MSVFISPTGLFLFSEGNVGVMAYYFDQFANVSFDGSFTGVSLNDGDEISPPDDTGSLIWDLNGRYYTIGTNARQTVIRSYDHQYNRIKTFGDSDSWLIAMQDGTIKAQVGLGADLFIDENERVYRAGFTFDSRNGVQLAVSRTNSKGVLDTTWGSNGLQITHDLESIVDTNMYAAFIVGPTAGGILVGAQYSSLTDQWFEVKAF